MKTPLDRATRLARGFSVLEALVALSIFLVVLTATLMIYAQSQKLFTSGERTAEVQDHARLAMGEMTREIRMAGYFPENFDDSSATPSVAAGIRVATDSTLAIFGDADDSGASNLFLYCLDGESLRRQRAPVTDTDAFDCAAGDEVASNVIDLQFTYYDDSGDPLPDPPSLPYALDDQPAGAEPEMSDLAERGSVRRVVITLTARKALPANRWKEYSLVSNVWLRNNG